MQTRILRLVIALALTVPGVAAAQDPVEFHIGGGVAVPVGDVADSFDTGFNFSTGLTFNANEAVGFMGEYQYFRFGGPDRTFDNVATPTSDRILIESNHQMNVVDFNVVLRAGGTSGMRAYLLAGPGVYWRKVQLTTPTVGFITVCDPVLVRVLPDGGVDRRHHRRPHLDRLRHQHRRRRQFRGLLRGSPLSLRVGPEGRDAGRGAVVREQRVVYPAHRRLPLLGQLVLGRRHFATALS